jgi:hypothetical protein
VEGTITDIFLGLQFDGEDGGDVFVRNVTLLPNHKALQTRRTYRCGTLKSNIFTVTTEIYLSAV